jgi:hypothetical protein
VWVKSYTPKRFPSRRWAIAHRVDMPRQVEDENDDEYEDEAPEVGLKTANFSLPGPRLP